MNSPESPIFLKSKLAFGLFQAQKHIREKDEVILVEGYFDVLALHAAGFENVVATCGTSLTPDHLHAVQSLRQAGHRSFSMAIRRGSPPPSARWKSVSITV